MILYLCTSAKKHLVDFMIISTENVLLVGAILLFLSVLIGKTGARYGVKA